MIGKKPWWKPSLWPSVIVGMFFFFDLYLINTFTKSEKAERSTEIMFKLTLSCLSVTAKDWTKI